MTFYGMVNGAEVVGHIDDIRELDAVRKSRNPISKAIEILSKRWFVTGLYPNTRKQLVLTGLVDEN